MVLLNVDPLVSERTCVYSVKLVLPELVQGWNVSRAVALTL